MLLCTDADAASADLASGVLACPLVPDRAAAGVGLRTGRRDPGAGRRAPLAVAPAGQCRPCGATHVLLPSWVGSPACGRRGRDRAGGRRVVAARHGTGPTRRPGRHRARLAGLPAATTAPALSFRLTYCVRHWDPRPVISAGRDRVIDPWGGEVCRPGWPRFSWRLQSAVARQGRRARTAHRPHLQLKGR